MIGRPDLSGHIGDIARLLLGEPNKALSTRTQWRYGNHGSIAVEIAGPKRGEWYDHETNRGGGPWEMLYLIGELDKDETEHWLRDKLGIGDSPGRQRVIKSYLYRDERDAVRFKV